MGDFSGIYGAANTDLGPGDLSTHYVGANLPLSINRPLNGGAVENEDPEYLLISKERWQIVRQVVLSNPKTSPFLEWLLDHFSGYSFSEIGERYGVTRQVAFYRITDTIDCLKKKIRGHQF